MGLLDGERAVITGGASGIGRATARRMAEEGASVSVIDLNGDAASEVAAEIGGHHFVADVTDPDGLRDAVDDAASAMGGITVLYNNAGIGSVSPLHEWDPDEWNRLLAVNLTGVYLGFRAAIPHIRATGRGSIVSTASISGTRPAAGEAPYSAAKAGVAAITASAALEYGPHIRVNSVSPGMILTALTQPLMQFLPDERAAIRADHAARADRRARGRRRRGGLLVLGPGPLHHRPEHRGGRGHDPARVRHRRHPRADLRPARPLTGSPARQASGSERTPKYSW